MKKYLLGLFIFCVSATSYAIDRAIEIKAEMWSSGDKAFAINSVPQKWAEKSAVIIAQTHRFEYRKAVVGSMLRKNQYHHYRIKLLDKNAVDKYAEMNFDVSVPYLDVYVGFKVIKPDGREVIVDLSRAIKMERTDDGRKISYNKIAIPGLEPGDILDYYICEEASEPVYSYLHFYDPVIYSLPQEYPMMYYKVQFRADRKCYINLKSVNGAPEFKLLTDEKNDEQYYTIEGVELENADDQRWLFKYRDLPTIKFRAAFAKNEAVVTVSDVLLGEKRIAKTNVTVDELEELTANLIKTPSLDYSYLKKYAKTNFKGVTDPFELASKAYYYLRSRSLIQFSESRLWRGESYSASRLAFFSSMHAFLKDRKIAHDVIVTSARNISDIDDVIMENELDWLIRVRKGTQYLYLSSFSVNTMAGSFDPLLEGAEAYAMDGLLAPSWQGKKFVMPTLNSLEHRSDITQKVMLGKDMTTTSIQVSKVLTGRNKMYEQYYLLDYYDYESEEKKFSETDKKPLKKNEEALKTAYMNKRMTNKYEWLKGYVEENYEFKSKEPKDLRIEQTGRFHDKPQFKYSFLFETEDLVKKAGPNYILDIGRLIEAQVKIDKEEIDRNTNVYLDNMRSFNNTIIVEIPAGYSVEGIERFNINTENKYGGFSSKARVEGNTIVIEALKHYEATFIPKSDWVSIVEFLNAAYNFNELKLLLKKSG
jgi:hypothetical protein